MTPLSTLERERAHRAWVRRHEERFPFAARWSVFRARAAHTRSWREVWQDVIYLVCG